MLDWFVMVPHTAEVREGLLERRYVQLLPPLRSG